MTRALGTTIGALAATARLVAAVAALTAFLPAAAARAATYEVGPGKPYARGRRRPARPGDLVLLSGGATYPGGLRLERDGSASAPITIRGVGNRRPVIAGATNTIELAGGPGGVDPGLDAEQRPVAGSPLIDVGYAAPLTAAFEPPLSGLMDAAAVRPLDDALDIGAYELPDPRFLRGPGVISAQTAAMKGGGGGCGWV
jgi:hypothetical protein